MSKTLTTPFTLDDIRSLRAGDRVELSGTVYTGRDAAHKRLCTLLDKGESLPVDLAGQAIYFVGPCPAPPGRPIGSAGPTTSGRMDFYSPQIIAKCGLRAMIGKGDRSQAVKDAMKEYGCVYFAATGGAGALIANSITAAEVVAFDDLGPEAIYKLTFDKLPLVVAIDSEGNSLY
ncbi:MAG: Fe-S-containing hydro-lyase [Lentisphaeria bacterium]|nr:Fe-S-containing hydro-lyase [Lentisphaeria bacterium]